MSQWAAHSVSVLATLATLATDRGAIQRYEGHHESMGTIFSVIAYGEDPSALADGVQRAFKEIDRLNDLMSNYRPHSELSTINREASHRTVVVTPELFGILLNAVRYSDETGGAFDISIGSLMKSWGLYQRWGWVPLQAELAESLKRTGYRHMKLDTETQSVYFDVPGVEIDLGGIGKGYTVDRIVQILSAAGITRALVSSGMSSIFALGSAPGEKGWGVSVSHPLDHKGTIISLRLQNLAISVSGHHEQAFALGDTLYFHIINPADGVPTDGSRMSVVISRSATQSDALSTAFLVADVETIRSFLKDHPDLTAILCLPTRSGRGRQVVMKSSVTTAP